MKNHTDRKNDSKLRLADIEDLRGAFGAERTQGQDSSAAQAEPKKTIMCVNW